MIASANVLVIAALWIGGTVFVLLCAAALAGARADDWDYVLVWRQWKADGGKVISPPFYSGHAAGAWRRVHGHERLTLWRQYGDGEFGQASGEEIASALLAGSPPEVG